MFEVLGLGFWVGILGLGFWVGILGLGFWVWASQLGVLGLRVLGLGF